MDNFEMAQLENIYREARKIRDVYDKDPEDIDIAAQKIIDDVQYLLPNGHRFKT